MAELTMERPILTTGEISIKPFFDGKANMGNEKYKNVIFEECAQYDEPVCLVTNGVNRYKTGLDEFAPEIKLLKGPEKIAKIKAIRLKVAELEHELNSNVIPTPDKHFVDEKSVKESAAEFWDQVISLKPDNIIFWSGAALGLKLSNNDFYFDMSNTIDKIKFYVAEGGGYSLVAKSLAEARNRVPKPRWYLDKVTETVAATVEFKKLKLKAGTLLSKLYDGPRNVFMYVTKIYDPNSVQYRNDTSSDVFLDNCEDMIQNGKDKKNPGKNIEIAIRDFIEIAQLPVDILKLKAVVKDASYYKIIANNNGMITEMGTGIPMGRTSAEVVQFLNDATNAEVAQRLIDSVDDFWNKKY